MQFVITLNYSTIAVLHAVQITASHATSFQPAFISRFPVTDLNGYSSTAFGLFLLDVPNPHETKMVQKETRTPQYTDRFEDESIRDLSQCNMTVCAG
jgi:hypothetical protein